MREDDDAHDSMECVLNWRWLGGQSHCYTFGVWRCLVRWGGFYFFDNSWKKPIMRLIFVTFIQCEEFWGRRRGLHSMRGHSPHCDWSVLSSCFTAFLGASFAGTFIFSWESLTTVFFFGEHEDILSWMLTGSGNHPCSVQVVLPKGYVVLDIGFWAAEKVVS